MNVYEWIFVCLSLCVCVCVCVCVCTCACVCVCAFNDCCNETPSFLILSRFVLAYILCMHNGYIIDTFEAIDSVHFYRKCLTVITFIYVFE